VTASSRHRRRGIRGHRPTLEPRDVATQIGLRVTSAARTVLDIAPRLTDKALRRAVAELRRAGYLHLDQLGDLLARFPHARGRPGCARCSTSPVVARRVPSSRTRHSYEGDRDNDATALALGIATIRVTGGDGGDAGA